MQTPVCSIIIPVFNKWELTRNCLMSLKKNQEGHDFEVVVVDNNSTDATADRLIPFGKELFGDRFVHLVFPENRNFGPASNAGARLASSPLLFFLNNDTLVLSGWLQPLLEAMGKPDPPGAVGPLLIYQNKTVQHVGVSLSPGGPFHLYAGYPMNHPLVHKPRKLQFLTGAAFMVRADTFWECGGFLEHYVNGYEDLDLSVAVRGKGHYLCCVPSSVIVHLESQSPGRMDAERRNAAIFGYRCRDRVHLDCHHHYLRDGFRIFVNDLMNVQPRMPETESADLLRRLDQGEATLVQLLKESPLWIKGREIAMEQLIADGKIPEALMISLEIAHHEGLRSRFQMSLELAISYGDTVCAASMESVLNKMRDYCEDPVKTRNAISKMKLLRKDPTLLALYEEKYRELHPNG